MASSQTMEEELGKCAADMDAAHARVRERDPDASRLPWAVLFCVLAVLMAGAVPPGVRPAPTAQAAMDGRLDAVEDPTVTLRPGSTGPRVVALQRALHRAGFAARADGRYGPRTEQAVRSFQREAGTRIDGIAGSATLNLLYERYGESRLAHRVRPGETLWELAQLYDVTVGELRALNHLSTDMIRVGQRLRLPIDASLVHRSLAIPAMQTASQAVEQRVAAIAAGGPTPLHYVVRPGDSLYVLARRFGSSVEEIAEENGIATPSHIRVGQDIIIPVKLRGGTIGDVRLRSAPRPGLLLWPVEGPISSPYGSRIHPLSGQRDFHSGLDIAVSKGTPVRAAFHGIVREARWMSGLGLAVVIDHGHGITTRYGHNSKLLVKPGDEVQRGEIVARSGSTGLSTGPHVHFMVLRNGETLNPAGWLP